MWFKIWFGLTLQWTGKFPACFRIVIVRAEIYCVLSVCQALFLVQVIYMYFFFKFSKQFFLLLFSFFLIIIIFICSGFCHTLKWISHGFTCVPHPDPRSQLPLRCIEQSFRLCGRRRGWDVSREQHRNMYII